MPRRRKKRTDALSLSRKKLGLPPAPRVSDLAALGNGIGERGGRTAQAAAAQLADAAQWRTALQQHASASGGAQHEQQQKNALGGQLGLLGEFTATGLLDAACPKSMVIRRGRTSAHVVQLVQDMRRMMQPFTMINLRESKRNTLKDFVSVAPTLGVSQMMIFTQSDVGTNLRLLRVPRGPTLSFRVLSYALLRDIVNAQRHPHAPGAEFLNPPLVVLSGFKTASDAGHIKVMGAMFQNMFPAIDVRNARLAECRRVVLFKLVKQTHAKPKTAAAAAAEDEGKRKEEESSKDVIVEMRHYLIRTRATGFSKGIKRIVTARSKVPDMHNLTDVADYVLDPGAGSSSDSEGDERSRVVLPQDMHGGMGSMKQKSGSKSAIRLKEVGPRLTLKLVKIQEGFDEGRTLFHSYVSKTATEIKEEKVRRKREKLLKAKRRREQEENVRRKEASKEVQRERERKRFKEQYRDVKRSRRGEGSGSAVAGDAGADPEDRPHYGAFAQDDDNSDAEWYEREVGEAPLEGTLVQRGAKRRGRNKSKK